MCSIAGIINFNSIAQARDIAATMNGVMTHRGPDDAGIWSDRRAVLAHRRLSIIDLSGGTQPLGNEDGSIQIVFNGEIYNYRQLRDRLKRRGHRFKTASDTEVIVHLYEEYGSELARHLQGMFAFAIWDSATGRVLLVRDRTGQKPLCYFQNGAELVFASELQGLRCHPQAPAELDPDAVTDFLSLQYIPSPFSVFKGIRKLPPGSMMIFDADNNTAEIRRWWQPDYRNKLNISFEDASVKVRELVTAAVKKRLMSEVPFGVFLSGGLDSAIVASLMTQLRAPATTSAFTIGFDDPAYDERSGANLMAEHINQLSGGKLQHYVKNVKVDDFELIPKLIRHFGEPFADASMLPTYLLCGFAREQATMVLSGDGADEVFAGYERYLVMKYAGYLNPVRALFPLFSLLLPDSGERTRSGRARRFCRVIGTAPEKRYPVLLDRCPQHLKNALVGERLRDAAQNNFISRFCASELSAAEPAELAMETDLHSYLPGDILPKVDITSMAASLEVRSPFLDHEVIEFAAALPLKFKQCGTSRKHILKAAFADLLPDEIRNGSKRGFGVPLAALARGAWKKQWEETIRNSTLFSDCWLNAPVFERLWNEHQTSRRDHSYILWNILILAIFLEQNRR